MAGKDIYSPRPSLFLQRVQSSKNPKANGLMAPPTGQTMLLNNTRPWDRAFISITSHELQTIHSQLLTSESVFIAVFCQHIFFLPQRFRADPARLLKSTLKHGGGGSLEQKTTCHPVVWLLDEARGSSVKRSASNLHHHSLEVSTLRLLRTETRENEENFVHLTFSNCPRLQFPK